MMRRLFQIPCRIIIIIIQETGESNDYTPETLFQKFIYLQHKPL